MGSSHDAVVWWWTKRVSERARELEHRSLHMCVLKELDEG